MENRIFLLAEEKSSFSHEGGQTLEELLRDPMAPPSLELLKISRHSVEQPPLVRLILSRGLSYMIARGPFLCNSIIIIIIYNNNSIIIL